MKRLIIIVLLFTCAQVRAQVNYVLNPSFEDYSQCPDSYDDVGNAYHWSAIDSVAPGTCLPEYCNICSTVGLSGVPFNVFFFQYPRTGEGVMDVLVFYNESTLPAPFNLYRDYLQGRLYSPLTAGVSYCVTFYVNLAEESNYAIDRIGAFLDDGSIDTTSTCGFPQTQYKPQVEYSGGILNDTLNWTRVEGTFIADGTEKFITIGNFYDLANTDVIDIKPNCLGGCHYSWMVIDDVSVIESNLPAFAGNDTTINEGDSLFIGRTPEIGLECKWYVNGNVIDSGAGIWAHPAVTTTYVVEQTLCGLVKTDTVVVTVILVGVNDVGRNNSIKIYPNPASTELHIIIADKSAEVMINNSIGQLMYSGHLTRGTNDIDIDKLPVGVYSVTIEVDGLKEVRRFVKM